MSSSGGSSLSGRDIEDLRRAALDQATSAEAVAETNHLLDGFLSRVDQRDVNKVRSALDLLQEVIEDLLEDEVRLIFGGSVAKHTYVDGLSDVDALVVLNADLFSEEVPSGLVRDFATALRERLGAEAEDVKGGRMAVTVRFRDGIEVDLLPAIRRGDHVAIASEDGTQWADIRPARFARKLQTVNEHLNGRLFKTIKLAKSILSALPATRHLTGYHIESLAIEAFEGYQGGRSSRELLQHFMRQAERLVRSPIRDSTGQSVHVDDYLGAANSVERKLRADSLGKLSRRLDTATTVAQWRRIIEDVEL